MGSKHAFLKKDNFLIFFNMMMKVTNMKLILVAVLKYFRTLYLKISKLSLMITTIRWNVIFFRAMYFQNAGDSEYEKKIDVLKIVIFLAYI
jgi:hypothetical protein